MRVKIYRKIIRPIINGKPFNSWWDDDKDMKEWLINHIKETFYKEDDNVTFEWEEKFIECGEIERGGAWY